MHTFVHEIIEGVELRLLHLHTNQDLACGTVFSLYVFHFKEAVEDATEGLDLVDALQLGQLLVMLSLSGISSLHQLEDFSLPKRTTSSIIESTTSSGTIHTIIQIQGP